MQEYLLCLFFKNLAFDKPASMPCNKRMICAVQVTVFQFFSFFPVTAFPFGLYACVLSLRFLSMMGRLERKCVLLVEAKLMMEVFML